MRGALRGHHVLVGMPGGMTDQGEGDDEAEGAGNVGRKRRKGKKAKKSKLKTKKAKKGERGTAGEDEGEQISATEEAERLSLIVELTMSRGTHTDSSVSQLLWR